MHSSIPFTQEAYDEMLHKQATLKVEEAAVLVRLKDAREQGDLSENGAYKYAKMELGSIRRQLARLKVLIDTAAVIKPPVAPDTVVFGCKVKVQNLEGGEESEYQMVSKHESNPSLGKLSLHSPLGSQLTGKSVGAIIDVTTPRGNKQYRIVSIS